jgi:hypothetical protein
MMITGAHDGRLHVRWQNPKRKFTAASPIAAVNRMVDALPVFDELHMPMNLYVELAKAFGKTEFIRVGTAPTVERSIRIIIAPPSRDLQSVEAYAGEDWLGRCIFPGERLYPIFQSEGAEAIPDSYRSPLLESI